MALRTFTLVGLLMLAGAPAAGAATGATELDLGGSAVKELTSQQVRITARAPARKVSGTLRLPVSKGVVASSAYLDHRGAVVLRRRTRGVSRTLALTRIQVRLGTTSKVIATLGKQRLTAFTVASSKTAVSLNAANGSASLRGSRLALTRAAGAVIKRKLGLRRLPAGAFGRVAVDALVGGAPAGSGGGSGGGGGGSTPPSSTPITDEPPVLARPAGAVDVTGATITWHVRPSWIRYVNTGEGTTPFAGATGDPADATPECGEAVEPPVSLVYAFHFPFARGWYDAASKVAGVYFAGGVNFKYTAHGIDLDTKEPEIELNGASSRAIFRFDGRQSTAVGNKRAVMVDLNIAAAPPVEAPGTVTYDRIPATIPQGGSQSVFAGFYQPGERFGCVSISFTHGG